MERIVDVDRHFIPLGAVGLIPVKTVIKQLFGTPRVLVVRCSAKCTVDQKVYGYHYVEV